MRITGAFQILAVTLTLCACSQAKMQTSEAYLGPSLARPDRVVVSYFSIASDQVKLDQGVGARVTRAANDQPQDELALRAAKDTQAALAERIVEQLNKYGLPAELSSEGAAYPRSVLVQGQIVGIDQGNRTRRMLVGLGAGKSSVSADAQIYYATNVAPPRFMMAFEGSADSGHMPGAAETMGAGAVAQRATTSAVLTGATHAGAETHRATDTAEADKLGDGIALRIGQFAVDQGWIPRTAIQ